MMAADTLQSTAAGDHIIRVCLPETGRDYSVVIGTGLLGRAAAALRPLLARPMIFVLTDEQVAARHAPSLIAGLAAEGIAAQTLVLPSGEAQKSFASLERVLDWLIEAGAGRTDCLLALGGGVIGDLGGLASALMKRGMHFVQAPTTLLAQVDSSVGGKTAINAKAGKNLVGLFRQPGLVLADLSALDTLPAREMRAGYAEVVKYGLLGDRDFFGWCEANCAGILARAPGILGEAVVQSVAAKARIVAADERETGMRALLNLGHSFAHALEAIAGLGQRARGPLADDGGDPVLLHGEAVAAGMRLAFDFSAAIGMCPPEEAARVSSHLVSAGFEIRLPMLTGGPFRADDMLGFMRHDKKNSGGAMTLILASAIGAAEIVRDVDEARLREFLRRQTGEDSE